MCRSTNDCCSQYGSGDGGCITCAIRAMNVDCIIRWLVWGDGGCITCAVRPMGAYCGTCPKVKQTLF